MRTRLLKRLRKQAYNKFRLYYGTTWYVVRRDTLEKVRGGAYCLCEESGIGELDRIRRKWIQDRIYGMRQDIAESILNKEAYNRKLAAL